MEEEKPIEASLEHTIEFNRPMKRFIFIMLVVIFTFSNFDNGINPAATDEIKKDLGDISDSQLGLFGSADYLGRIISSMIIYYIINTKYRKIIIIVSLILKAATLFIVYFITNYWVVLVSRGISGFSQVFFTIYFPVWCDQFGSKKKRTMMISMIHLGCPLGIVLGFVVCSLCKKNVSNECNIILIVDISLYNRRNIINSNGFCSQLYSNNIFLKYSNTI